MKNPALMAALNVSMENMDDEFVDKSLAEISPAIAREEFEGLATTSGDLTISQVEQAEEEVAHSQDQLDAIKTVVADTDAEDVATLESLSNMVDVIAMRYGQEERTSLESLDGTGIKENILGRIESHKVSLESALTVSQESWSVKDLWDRAGGVERNASELASVSKQLDAKKQWFSDHGIVIDALGQLVYMTVNEQFTKNIVKDTADTAQHVEQCLSIAKDAVQTSQKIADYVKAANLGTDEGVMDLFKKVTALKNPSVEARQKLDGALLLNNERADFKINPLGSKTGANLGSWENIGYYSKTTLGKAKHDTKASAFLRVPAWLVGYSVGGNVTRLLLKGTITSPASAVVAAVVIVGAGVAYGFAASGMLNDRKKSKEVKNNIKYEEMSKSFDKVIHLANSSAALRRSLPNIFQKAFESKHETIRLLDATSGLGPQAKAAIDDIRKIYKSTDRLGWALNQWAFGIMETMTKNTQAIARKMLKAVK